MGHSSWMLMLLAIVIHKIIRVNGENCQLISPGCLHDDHSFTGTFECVETTDGLRDTVIRDCFSHILKKVTSFYPIEGVIPYNIEVEGFKLSLKLSHFDVHNGSLNDVKSFKTYIENITLQNGNLLSIPNLLYDLEIVNTIAINKNMLQKVNIKKFSRMTKLMKLDVSYNSIAVLEDENEFSTTVSSKMIIIDLSHNAIENIPANSFLHFNQLKHLNLSYNSIKHFDILTFEGISQLETLDLSYNQLFQIGHTLQRFVNLKELSLAHNNLSAIVEPNFNTISKLEKVNISYNKLSKIDDAAFQSLSSLTELDMSYNEISDIRNSFFKNSAKLYLLHLAQNHIHFIEPGAFKGKYINSFLFDNNNLTGCIHRATFEGINTKSLDLSGGMITSLESEAFRNSYVRFLNLSSNLISNISKTSFRLMNNLTELDLSNNNISAIDFDTRDMKDLVVLNVRNNSLTKIVKGNFQNLTILAKLDLSYNDIFEVESQSFEDLKKLESLEMNNNIISSSLKANTFKGLSSLIDLQISYTRIPFFENESFYGLNSLKILNSSHGELTTFQFNTFKNTGSIKTLDLSYNILENFVINTSCLLTLENLYLNDNKIRDVTNNTFSGLVHLITLNLNNNYIQKLGPTVFASLSKMNKLYLSFNDDIEISSTVFDNLKSLTEVILSNNRKQISFENATGTTIKRLYLSSCQMKDANSIFIFNVQNLEMLDLSVNKITFIDKFTFQNMPDLFWLDLSFNLISFIQPGSFLKTNSIKSLNLHRNEIQALQYGSLDGMNELHELNLSSNILNSFEINMLLKTPQISVIALDDNAIEDLKFHQFLDTTIKRISVGGNLISCEVFVSLKKEGLKNISLTAERLDYYLENVDGISCRSESHMKNSVIWPHLNNSDINATVAFVTLKNEIENFTASRDLGSKNEFKNSHTTNKVVNSLQFLETRIGELTNVIKVLNNRTQVIDNDLNNLSHMLTLFLNKLKNSYTTKFEDLKKENNVSNSYHYEAQTEERNKKFESNGILYVIAVCLTVNVIILLLVFYKLFKLEIRDLCNNVGNLRRNNMQQNVSAIEME